MNRFLHSLVDFYADHLLGEKWLLAPSSRTGRQWLDALARNGHPPLNVRVKTLRRMALDLAGDGLAREGLRLIPAQHAVLLVDRVFRNLREARGGYLASLEPSPGLSEALYRSIRDLRMAGAGVDALTPERFEVAGKCTDLAQLYDGYLAELRDGGYIDPAGVLEKALEAVRAGQAAGNVLVLVPEDLDCTALEKQLIAAFPEDCVQCLSIDETGGRPEAEAAFFRASGEVNEVREVFRRCLEGGVPLDQVELLHTDPNAYVPLAYELACGVDGNGGADLEALPVTFAEGIPSRYAAPGRALSAWVEWGRANYPQSALVRMLEGGLLSEQGKPVESMKRCAAALRSVRILAGRERYVQLLDETAAGLEVRLSARVAMDEDAAEAWHEREAEHRGRLEDLRWLRAYVGSLLQLEDEAADAAGILAAAGRFLKEFAGGTNEFDNFVRMKLCDEVDAMRAFIETEGAAFHLDAWDWLAGLPETTRVGGSAPQPGKLHVDHLLNGGHSGRPHTFIIGLDDARFPGSGRPDPLILDGERKSLTKGRRLDLPTAAARLAERVEGFRRLLARLRGRVTLGYSCRDIAGDHERFPSSLMLEAFHAASGDIEADQAAFTESLGPPAAFAPAAEAQCLDPGDWWLWQLCRSEEKPDAGEILENLFPHLARGAVAEGRLFDGTFSPYTGRVPDAGEEHDPTKRGGPVMSANRLQTAGACPRRYFFHYVLGIVPPEELEVDEDIWLDPLDYGSLLHNVYRDFLFRLAAREERPDFKQHEDALLELLEEHIQGWRERRPPPSESVFRNQRADLRDSARIFLRVETDYCEHNKPSYFEVAVGMAPEAEGSLLDTPDPARVALPTRGALRVRGRIDRIDQVDGESRYALWDYKTGSPRPYEKKPPFNQGRVIQNVLYCAMADGVLKRVLGREASVDCFGYFFAAAKGGGARIEWTPGQLAEGMLVVERLCATIANGCFLATTDKHDCFFCDYLPICGPVDQVAVSSKDTLEIVDDEALQPFKELRGHA